MSSSADWRTTTDIPTLNKLIKVQKAKFTRAMSRDTKTCAEFDILDLYRDIEAEENWKELTEMMTKRT
ncbi:hypothetical protein E8E11_010048 [Didymella keratinophila]|nr:hypothetical protein E8E11_010048 [Didymella keratinophila]